VGSPYASLTNRGTADSDVLFYTAQALSRDWAAQLSRKAILETDQDAPKPITGLGVGQQLVLIRPEPAGLRCANPATLAVFTGRTFPGLWKEVL
jgi:hypothetical protein